MKNKRYGITTKTFWYRHRIPGYVTTYKKLPKGTLLEVGNLVGVRIPVVSTSKLEKSGHVLNGQLDKRYIKVLG